MYKISYRSLFETKHDWLNFAARFCFQITLLIGLVEIISWIFDLRGLLSLNENFLPIAPDTAIFTFLLSSALFYSTFHKTYKFIDIVNYILVSVIIIYSLLKCTELFTQTDLTFSSILFPSNIYHSGFLIKRMSPITGLLFFVSGIASLYYFSHYLRDKYYNVIGILGGTVLIIGFIITTGYSFGTPLFYSGAIIPVSLPAAVGLTLIGLGITAAAGPNCFINRTFTGTSVKAILIRTYTPIIIISTMLVGLIHQALEFGDLNQGFIASMASLLFISLTIYLSVRIAFKISGIIEKAEADRKHAEEILKDNLLEKETLLKELNHRVKNNFNLINSIIELSSYKNDTVEKMRSSLDMIKKRIRTLSLIHSHLYNSKSYNNIDFKNYILKLTNDIVTAYQNGKNIGIKYDIENITLPITKAIPCGLIINELTVNSIKHAFEDKNEGYIYISFKQINGSIELAIRDDGKGLPDKFSLENSETLGYTIIRELSLQLDGSFEINSDKGTYFKIIFPSS